MKINKEVRVELTVKDLKEIISEHLKLKGIDVKSIRFNLKTSYHQDDCRGEFPFKEVDNVVCNCVEI